MIPIVRSRLRQQPLRSAPALHLACVLHHAALLWLLLTGTWQLSSAAEPADRSAVVLPEEDPNALLHNPAMGWVVYENYAIDQDRNGSSTLLTLPTEDFAGVDAVALMFSWADIEKSEDVYDFSKANFAFDYWRQRGKEIHLRVSAESLLWWAKRDPPAGEGVPAYVLDHLAPHEKQTRTESDLPYVVVDARNPFYQERLRKFLGALRANFENARRPVTLIDLRGFGLWGEWHSGFRYADVAQRHDALCGILALWSRALPDHFLSLSYSYDPDGPRDLYAGPRDRFDAAAIHRFDEYLSFSAFDCALHTPNITFRRDGCGGAVHSNERHLAEKAFAMRSKGPFMAEFLGGYASNRKAGAAWLSWMLTDALSLHPNYIALLGWQGGDARDFLHEETGLFARGLREMGYRLMPQKITFPKRISAREPFVIETTWINQAVGRAPRNFHLVVTAHDPRGKRIGVSDTGEIPTAAWIRAETYRCSHKVQFGEITPGNYMLRLHLVDPQTSRTIELPVRNARNDGTLDLGTIAIKTASDS
jgi:hypothetical protein